MKQALCDSSVVLVPGYAWNQTVHGNKAGTPSLKQRNEENRGMREAGTEDSIDAGTRMVVGNRAKQHKQEKRGGGWGEGAGGGGGDFWGKGASPRKCTHALAPTFLDRGFGPLPGLR